jgi:aspartate kinase
MIVMKFGGVSLASPASIKRIASIVRSQVHRHPIVVVSAIGNTTDHLLELLKCAARAESYLAWTLQEEVKTYHFGVAEDLLNPDGLAPIDEYIRQTFRDLHVRMLEVCEGERNLTQELRDWVVSLGEQLSSTIVTAALRARGVAAVHMDATKLILTDDHFTNAAPRYWETYARIRWSVPIAARSHVVVLGGFLGATEDGRTTTLGRGGSDLTASLIGAAVNAEEIQVWKDVDGMLTWDPKIRSGGYRLKRLSYEEADELAHAGAKILHPETIAPAQRLRIPVIIRNTFHPTGEGTTIDASGGLCTNPIKSIVCKENITVCELRSPTADRRLTEYAVVIERLCRERKSATLLALSGEVIYLAVESTESDLGLSFAADQCVEVHVRTHQAILTLVGEKLKRCSLNTRLIALLSRKGAVVLPQDAESCSVRIVVPQEELTACSDILQHAFFGEVDPSAFAVPTCVPEEPTTRRRPNTHVAGQQHGLAISTDYFAFPGVKQ